MLTEKSKKDLLARVLESLSLAYVEYVNGGLEPLQAYISLRIWVHPLLMTFGVTTGWTGHSAMGVSGAARPDRNTLVSGGTETDRLQKLLQLLEKTQSSYEEELAELEEQWRRTQGHWGRIRHGQEYQDRCSTR